MCEASGSDTFMGVGAVRDKKSEIQGCLDLAGTWTGHLTSKKGHVMVACGDKVWLRGPSLWPTSLLLGPAAYSRRPCQVHERDRKAQAARALCGSDRGPDGGQPSEAFSQQPRSRRLGAPGLAMPTLQKPAPAQR